MMTQGTTQTYLSRYFATQENSRISDEKAKIEVNNVKKTSNILLFSRYCIIFANVL